MQFVDRQEYLVASEHFIEFVAILKVETAQNLRDNLVGRSDTLFGHEVGEESRAVGDECAAVLTKDRANAALRLGRVAILQPFDLWCLSLGGDDFDLVAT